MLCDLTRYHWIVLNSSAGKDSQAMLDYVVEQADGALVSRSRLLVAHADLGRVEWPGTRQLAEEQARHYGLEFIAVKRPRMAVVAPGGKLSPGTLRQLYRFDPLFPARYNVRQAAVKRSREGQKPMPCWPCDRRFLARSSSFLAQAGVVRS
jgi:hypothetical protein